MLKFSKSGLAECQRELSRAGGGFLGSGRAKRPWDIVMDRGADGCVCVFTCVFVFMCGVIHVFIWVCSCMHLHIFVP